ncbi:TauD/TfdA family dioxygenase [Aquabacterium sp. A7-Y]|uniref:TauD/TfdA family dioxygenase n=1 Tax=Aquabacterium sp. A7-Y TaxID=1349605 RepID=UPI00223DE1F1|nr:TauD/TfdA family dioxygenase [Aquabacterium sp. A7-Y]MCW7538197.1 TauD/TfdA family dioxygenase [Aquabacterium sp. A7-Y]
MEPILALNADERNGLRERLWALNANPYRDYPHFKRAISALIEDKEVPERLLRTCDRIREEREQRKSHAHLIRNCPIDPMVPVFDQNDPVQDKYRTKTTYVGEGILELFGQLTGTPLLAYDTRNNGDFFHDVYAHTRYSGTQTQKTDGELYFHNDRTAHPVRADYLALLGMRCYAGNRIYTGFIDGQWLLDHLSEREQALLRQPYYQTPYDEYSRDSNAAQVDSEPHLILEETQCFRYYDTRTKPHRDAPPEARDALIALKDAIVKARKHRIVLDIGDLLCVANQAGLHNRELVEVADAEQAKKRWLLKTYSFRSQAHMEKFADWFPSHCPGLVQDAPEALLEKKAA